MSKELILTKEEEKLTKHCEDFCPIHDVITNYNKSHMPIICCPSEMCKEVTKAYILNKRNKDLCQSETCA